MKNYFSFKNKNVLILGSSSGFGRLYSKVFYDLGANVLSIARNKKRLKSLKKECESESMNGTIDIMKCDINSNKNVNKLIKKIKKNYNSLNVVIYCCGFNLRQKFVDIKEKDFNKVMSTNYYSAFNIYKKLYPILIKSIQK